MAKKQSTKTANTAQPKTTEILVPEDVLREIRVQISHSLDAVIDLLFDSELDGSAQAAQLIRPAVERLEGICKENGFPQ